MEAIAMIGNVDVVSAIKPHLRTVSPGTCEHLRFAESALQQIDFPFAEELRALVRVARP